MGIKRANLLGEGHFFTPQYWNVHKMLQNGVNPVDSDH